MSNIPNSYEQELSPYQYSFLKSYNAPTVSTVMKRSNPSQVRDKMRIMSKQMLEMKDTLEKEHKAFMSLDGQSKKLTQVIDEELRGIKNAFSTLADATMEEVDLIKTTVQAECVDKLTWLERSVQDNYYRKEEVQIELAHVKEKCNDLIADSQKKFQRLDFELNSLRVDLKEMNEKNSTFKSDLLGAIREIKDICRTNSTGINKLGDDISIIKEDVYARVETLQRNNEDLHKQLHELNVDSNTHKSNADKELFDIKSELGFLNKSVKKIMYENEQLAQNHKTTVEQQQDYYNNKIDSFFEKIEQIHSNTERKVNGLERELSVKKEIDENNRRLMFKFEEKLDKIDNVSTDLTGVVNKVNAFEELMSVQRSELFRAMSDFETNVLKRHENFNRAFKVISSELNVPNPMLGTSFY